MNAAAPRILAALAVLSLWPALSPAAYGQAATHFMGAVTAIAGSTVTVKTAQGDERTVQVPATADIKRIEPGQTSLSAATAMPLSDLATGDRVLIWIDPNSPADKPEAQRIVAIKAADLARRRQQEAAAWQLGAGGLVKSVDAASGTIVLSTGAGATAKTVTVHTSSATLLKRYAPDSVSYDAAKPAPFAAIRPGDQLMARGPKNAEGTELTADEIVSGTFLNISGLVSSLDPDHRAFTIKDLATKKQYTVAVPAQAQMRQVPAQMARLLAARLKGTAPAPAAGEAVSGAGGERTSGASGSSQSGGGWQGRGQGAGGPSGDSASAQHPSGPTFSESEQLLSRAPAIHFADLKKGEAVMLVASPDGGSDIKAITLLAGVEALLEAPESQNLLANWSMGSGGEAAGEAAQ